MPNFVVPPWRLPLDAKQREGLSRFQARLPKDFLVVLPPGCGKTRLSLAIAQYALANDIADAVLVAVPSSYLRIQWAQEADRAGMPLIPGFGGRLVTGFIGGTVTFGGLVQAPAALERFVKSRRVLCILDELHKTNEWSVWGNAVERLFEYAAHRVLLSGTMFSSSGVGLPWIKYDEQQRVVADMYVTYREARELGLVRPVVPHVVHGKVGWSGSDGKVRSADVEDVLSLDDSSESLRGVLDDEQFIDELLWRAHETLRRLRATDPHVGGIAFGMSAAHVRKIARRIVAVTGMEPVVVLGEDGDADVAIERFRESRDHWIVSVRKAAEGVDLPRLRVEAYLTNVRSEAWVLQAISRVTRRRGSDTRPAYFFYPADPRLQAIVTRFFDDAVAAGGSGRDNPEDDVFEYAAIAEPEDPWVAKERVYEDAPQEALFEVRADLRARHTELVKAIVARYGVKPVEVYRQLKREFHTSAEMASVAQLRQRVRVLGKWLERGIKGQRRGR